VTPKEFAQPAFHSMTHHCNADGFSHREAKSWGTFPPAISVHGEITSSQPLPMPVATREVGGIAEPLMTAQALVHSTSDGQTGAALVPPSFQNLPPATGCHTCSEAVSAVPLNATRLIGPFHARVLGHPCRVLRWSSILLARLLSTKDTFHSRIIEVVSRRDPAQPFDRARLKVTQLSGIFTHRAPILTETALIFQSSFGTL
jgi:hypothetical protein